MGGVRGSPSEGCLGGVFNAWNVMRMLADARVCGVRAPACCSVLVKVSSQLATLSADAAGALEVAGTFAGQSPPTAVMRDCAANGGALPHKVAQ